MILEQRTFQQLTAPGYFNFSATQAEKTRKVAAWFDAVNEIARGQVNIFDEIFRLWASKTYPLGVVRTPNLQYRLREYGLDWFRGENAVAAALLTIVSRAWSTSTAENLRYILDRLQTAPFFWVDGVQAPQIVFGTLRPAVSFETLIIFSQSPTLPAQPANQSYAERTWSAPSGWSTVAENATYFSRGYLLEGEAEIAWLPPRSTSLSPTIYEVANLAGLPLAPNTGDLAVVLNDGTGDYGAVYYAEVDDGSLYGLGEYGVGLYGVGGDNPNVGWFKTTTRNERQGLVQNNIIPEPNPRAVMAKVEEGDLNPIISENPPPADGPTEGYGMFSGLSQQTITVGSISLNFTLTAEGLANLDAIIHMLRRIKPLNKFVVYYNVQNVAGDPVLLDIKDYGDV